MKKDTNREEKAYVKIWGEHIDLLRFIIGLITSLAILAVILLVVTLSGGTKEVKLVYGLIGIIIGFGFNIKFIKPKRNVTMKEASDNDN